MHWRLTIWRVYAGAGLSALLVLAVYVMPTQADRAEGAIYAWELPTPILGVGMVLSLVVVALSRRFTGRSSSIALVLALLAIWGGAGLAKYRAVGIIDDGSIMIGPARPYGESQRIPFSEITNLRVGCYSGIGLRRIPVDDLSFTFSDGRETISLADALHPKSPVTSDWIDAASAIRTAAEKAGASIKPSPQGISAKCLEVKGAKLAPADQARFQQAMDLPGG